MTEKYLWAGGAAVAGLVLGLAMSGGSDSGGVMTAQMEELQAGLGEALAAVSDKVDALAGGISANETAIAALTGSMGEQSASTAASLEALGAKAEADAAALAELRGALDQLSGDQASLTEVVGAITGDMDAMRGDLMGAMKDTLAAAAAAVGAGAAAAPAAPVAPAATQAVAAVAAAAPDPAPEAAAEADDGAAAEALAAAVGEDGLILSVGQTGAAGEAGVFLSRLSEAGAHLRIRGLGAVTAGIDGAAEDLGNGCAVALAGVAAGKAYLTVACAEPQASEAAADLPGATDLSLTVGQTGLFGDTRIFLSRLDGGMAHLRIFTLTGMSENATIGSRQAHVMENGCSVALKGLDGRTAHLAVACGEAAAALSELTTEVAAPAPATEPDAAAAPEPEAAPEPRLADALSETGLELRVGQTATVGDAKVFVQRLPDGTAQLMHVGQGPLVLDRFRPAELGNGCTLRLLGVQDGAAYIEPACSE